MKQILLLFALFFAMVVNAQNSKVVPVRLNSQNGQNNKKDSSSAQVDAINQRADALIKDVESMYQVYNAMEDKWFQKKKDITPKMEEVKEKQREEQDRKNQAEDSIKVINEELEWIRDLRAYYEKGSLDDLYRGDDLHPHADSLTLSLHKQLLGDNYPKKIDDLMLMAECANSLKKEYDAARNKDYRNRLAKMAECDTKWDIDGLLAVHGDIKEEVVKWDGHTLMDLLKFRKNLQNEYGVELDTEFPYLASQVRESIVKDGKKR